MKKIKYIVKLIMEVEIIRPLLKKYNIEDVINIIKKYIRDVIVTPPKFYITLYKQEKYKNRILIFHFTNQKCICESEFEILEKEIPNIVKKNNLFIGDTRLKIFFKNKNKEYYLKLEPLVINYIKKGFSVTIKKNKNNINII